MSAPVVIVDYNLEWPALFEEEKKKILHVMGDTALGIEHMGSTSVPGLAAKPIIDIMVAVRSLDDVTACLEPLATIGYEYAPEFEASIAERRFFRKGPEHARNYHLHIVEIDSEFWERHLLFRDFLRAHPDVAEQYALLKRDLAEIYGANREGYTSAKTAFVRSVEVEARAERASQVSTGHDDL